MSVDTATRERLKALAIERHEGNVSALITELAAEGERQAAFERAWAWYGGPEPTDAERSSLHAEWEEGWRLARAKRPKRASTSKKRKAA